MKLGCCLLRASIHRDLERRLRAQDYQGLLNIEVSAPLARGPFLMLTVCMSGMGAYPSIDCKLHRYRVDNGQTWNWRSLVAPAKQKKFLTECSRRLASAAEKAVLEKDPVEPDFGDDQRCSDETLGDFTFDANGALVITTYRGPHASGNYTFGTTFSAVELRKWADPQGPLGRVTSPQNQHHQ